MSWLLAGAVLGLQSEDFVSEPQLFPVECVELPSAVVLYMTLKKGKPCYWVELAMTTEHMSVIITEYWCLLHLISVNIESFVLFHYWKWKSFEMPNVFPCFWVGAKKPSESSKVRDDQNDKSFLLGLLAIFLKKLNIAGCCTTEFWSTEGPNTKTKPGNLYRKVMCQKTHLILCDMKQKIWSHFFYLNMFSHVKRDCMWSQRQYICTKLFLFFRKYSKLDPKDYTIQLQLNY